MKLSEQKCVACEGGIPPMTKDEAQKHLLEVEGWELEENKINKKHEFKNFKEALIFINKVGEIAEGEGHHPDIRLYSYKNVEITTYTHAIGGLSMNDFILAAKIDKL